MHRKVSAYFLAALATAASPGVGQQWTVEELRSRTPGFHEESYRTTLRQIAELVAHKEHAFAAICSTIQGDHREYMLKVERLLDRLADERWAVREDAESQLVQVGARALALIADRKQNGKTLEERVRSARIEQNIAARGTAEEEASIRLLRGLVAAAKYLGPNSQLASALVSASGHTDPLVVEGALRSLGSVGDEAVVPFLVSRLKNWEKEYVMPRRTILGSLTKIDGAAVESALVELIDAGELTDAEQLGVLMDVRQRGDCPAVIAKLQSSPNASVQAIAKMEWGPPPAGAEPPTTTLTLADRTELMGPLLGFRSDGVAIGAIEGLGTVSVPREQCAALAFDVEVAPLGPGDVRVFTVQGSLLVGSLSALSDTAVTVESKIFGAVEIAREDVQGIAIDPALDRLIGASPNSDRVRLKGGQLVDGTIRALDDASVTVAQGDETQVIKLADVDGLLFRRPQTQPRAAELFARVDLKSGDRLLARIGAADSFRIGFVVPGVGAAVIPTTDLRRLEFGVGGGALWGFTLVADYSENAVFELDDQQRVVFRLDDMYGVWDAECLDNGNLLIVEFALGRVVEMTRERQEVWSFDKLKNPYDADRLPNGNTLIADTYGSRVIEVDGKGEIVWTYDKGIKPHDVERLPNGNTLIADGKRDRVIEVDRSGEIVWSQEDLEGVWDADRLPNGNTLITQRRASHRVFEVDREGKTVFEIKDLSNPSDADRLPNGNTIVAEDGRVREFDRFGNQVWEHQVAWSVEVNRY